VSINEDFARFEGDWKGTNRLYLSWLSDPLKESESRMHISRKANGQFIQFDYDWEYEGEKQEGMLVLGCDAKTDAVQAVWTDSWHSRHTFMISDGTANENGTVSVKGYYKVPDHPDWGWRTEIIPAGEKIKLTMYNVSPENEEDLAVEVTYERA